MPCESCGPRTIPRGLDDAQVRELVDAQKTKTDHVTRMFCASLKSLSKTKAGRAQIEKMGKDVREWWMKHQLADKKRLAREKRARAKKAKATALKKGALDKLTKEERKALGV